MRKQIKPTIYDGDGMIKIAVQRCLSLDPHKVSLEIWEEMKERRWTIERRENMLKKWRISKVSEVEESLIFLFNEGNFDKILNLEKRIV